MADSWKHLNPLQALRVALAASRLATLLCFFLLTKEMAHLGNDSPPVHSGISSLCRKKTHTFLPGLPSLQLIYNRSDDINQQSSNIITLKPDTRQCTSTDWTFIAVTEQWTAFVWAVFKLKPFGSNLCLSPSPDMSCSVLVTRCDVRTMVQEWTVAAWHWHSSTRLTVKRCFVAAGGRTMELWVSVWWPQGINGLCWMSNTGRLTAGHGRR